MKYINYCLLLLFICSCAYKDVEVIGTTKGLSNAVVEISNDKNLWSENVINNQCKLLAKIPEADFYNLKIHINGSNSQLYTFPIYLDGGSCRVFIDSSTINSYPKIESPSSVQKDLDEYYKTSTNHELISKTFIESHPASIVSAYFLGLSETDIANDPKLYHALFQRLTPDVQNSFYGKQAKKIIVEYISVLPGSPLPIISGLTPDGEEFDNNVLKGKLTLVAFWASWEKKSKRDFDQLKAYYSRYHKQGFEILGIAIDKNEDKWKKVIAKNQLNWLHVADFKGSSSKNLDQFHTRLIPSYIIIGPDLKIIDHTVPLESVPIYINDYLKQIAKKGK